MSNFVIITLEEMHELLTKAEFLPITLPNTNEMVYDRAFKRQPNIVIRIYTSIENGVSRPIGADAIRIILFDKEINRPIGRATRTHRIKTWQDNLKTKVNEVWESIKDLQRCPYCNRYLVERKYKDRGNKGTFMGCSNWASCPKNIKREKVLDF